MNPQLRMFLVCLGLMAAPMVPIWIAGGREGSAPVVAVASSALFIGALMVGWWFVRREIRERERGES